MRGRGSARVSELATQLGVSPVTVRRDVEFLANEGRLDRVHGSVSWPGIGEGTPQATHAHAHAHASAHGPGSRELVIGMLAPNATYYFAEVIRGAHEAAAATGARLILRISDYRPQEDAGRAAGLLAAGAEGLLIAPGWKEPDDPVEHGAWIAGFWCRRYSWSGAGCPAGNWTTWTGSARTTATACSSRCAICSGSGTPHPCSWPGRTARRRSRCAPVTGTRSTRSASGRRSR